MDFPIHQQSEISTPNSAYSVDFLLRCIGDLVGIDNLQFTTCNACTLSSKNALDIQIEYVELEGIFIFLAQIGTVTENNKIQLYEKLLSANFLFLGTRGETLSIEAETGRIMLCLQFDICWASPESVTTLFKRFIGVAEGWHRYLIEHNLYSSDDDNILDQQVENSTNLRV